uniref:NADH-ubiquinone oxidoreductase chain 2 n=1 Tax=Neoasterolepisma foreli TaxID=2779710 RepID=A0A7L9R568_9INSE|nr:NADH dehydrogenase subunit 2 [Neoasterolepisma foreli]QOL10501.1 NADH dehydrogenase subunit 2 [Neoasterolepisma foreli]
MLTNPKNMMFLLTLTGGTMISMSATSWYGAWIGLEINLLSFIPLISKINNQRTTEAALKYFLVQALASSMIMFSLLSMIMMNFKIQYIILNSALLLKMGAAPFHIWLPEVMEGMEWINCILLMTIQKLAPTTLLSYSISQTNFLMNTSIILSALIGAFGGLNQTSMRKIMAFSSINHLSWIIISMKISDSAWMTYLTAYIMLTTASSLMFLTYKLYYLTQLFTSNTTPIPKMALFTSLLSLGGLPPFLGFMPKWLIITKMTEVMNIIMISTMIMMSLLTLYYYLRISMSALTLNYNNSIQPLMINNKHEHIISMIIIIMSIFGLILSYPMIMMF